MLKKFSTFITLSLSLFLLSSCGHREYAVNLNPNDNSDMYLTDNAVSSITPPIIFSKGKYIDSRKNKEYYGINERYIILTDNEFSDAFYDGLERFIESSNQSWSDIGESDIKVDVELLETHIDEIIGWTTIKYESRLSTKITFIDLKNSKAIYQQTYKGESYVTTIMGGHVSVFNKSVNYSMVECINKIGMDKGLYEVLKKLKSHPIP